MVGEDTNDLLAIPFTRKELGQKRPANTSAAIAYKPASGEVAEIDLIIYTSVAGSGGSTLEARIFFDADGTTYDKDSALVYDQVLDVGQWDWIVFDRPIVVTEQGSIGVRTSSSNNLNVRVFGKVRKLN